MSQFTKGPWVLSWVKWPKGTPIGFAIRPADESVAKAKRGVSIASAGCAQPDIHTMAVYEQDELEANARLIAAAPALYEAVKAVIASHCPNDKMFCGSCSPAREVLAYIDQPTEGQATETR